MIKKLNIRTKIISKKPELAAARHMRLTKKKLGIKKRF